ncbi:MAG: hypothetical protein JO129_00305 [Candidatus Dependentiae bacterium]|nr:hypothetical protein [Candidatus Dependentiae bacterium]
MYIITMAICLIFNSFSCIDAQWSAFNSQQNQSEADVKFINVAEVNKRLKARRNLYWKHRDDLWLERQQRNVLSEFINKHLYASVEKHSKEKHSNPYRSEEGLSAECQRSENINKDFCESLSKEINDLTLESSYTFCSNTGIRRSELLAAQDPVSFVHKRYYELRDKVQLGSLKLRDAAMQEEIENEYRRNKKWPQSTLKIVNGYIQRWCDKILLDLLIRGFVSQYPK